MSETSSRIVLAISKTPVISDWDRHRDLIMKLYLEEGKTLVEVKAILYKQHGFDATYDFPSSISPSWLTGHIASVSTRTGCVYGE